MDMEGTTIHEAMNLVGEIQDTCLQTWRTAFYNPSKPLHTFEIIVSEHAISPL